MKTTPQENKMENKPGHFSNLVKFRRAEQVVVYRSQFAGIAYFAYILCNHDGYRKIEEDFAAQTSRASLSEYGEVIYMDMLESPDDKALAFLKEWEEKNC